MWISIPYEPGTHTAGWADGAASWAARPGADLSAVQLQVEGAEAVSVGGAMLRLSAATDYAWPILHVLVGSTARQRCSHADRR